MHTKMCLASAGIMSSRQAANDANAGIKNPSLSISIKCFCGQRHRSLALPLLPSAVHPPSPPFPNTFSSTYNLHQAIHAHTSTRRAPPCPGMYMVCGWQPHTAHTGVHTVLHTDYGSLHAMCAALRGGTHCQGVLACCVVTCIIPEIANHGASIGSQATPADLTKLHLQMVDTVVHQCAYEEQPGARHLPNMAAVSA